MKAKKVSRAETIMKELDVERKSVIPFYLQIKDQLEDCIFNNRIKPNQLLPGIQMLAKELGVNAATVRKAFLELEKDGLIVVRKAKGTYVVDRKPGIPDTFIIKSPGRDALSSFREIIQELIRNGVPITKIYQECREIIKGTFDQQVNQYLVFLECNRHQLDVMSNQIEKFIGMRVIPLHISEMERALDENEFKYEFVKAIVTTEFHTEEVTNTLGFRYENIIILRMNMSSGIRNEINKIGPDENIAFICRHKNAIPLYKKMLSAQFGKRRNLLAACTGDGTHLDSVIKSADVLFMTPPTYQEIKNQTTGKRIFNVFDQIDPQSLRILKDTVLSG